MTVIPPNPSPNGYISFPVVVDPNQLFAQAVADIQAQLSAWTPQEGNLEVIVLEEVAQMMSVAAAVASQVPMSIFMAFGQLVGVPPITGVFATVPATVTMINNTGYTIPAGLQVAFPLSGNSSILFTVQSAVTIPSGSTTGDVILVCETVGSFPNGLASGTTMLLQQTFAQISSIVTTDVVSGGIDAETVTSYINRLSAELQLLAPRPILPADFAELATNVAGVFRAMAIDGLNPGRTITDGITTNGNPTIGSATANFTLADVGREVDATSFPPGTTLQTYISPSRFSASNNATTTGTAENMTFGDLTGQERCVTVAGLDENGATLSTLVNSNMQEYLQAKREVNFLVGTVFPTFTGIDVTVTCYADIGANTAAVQSAITATLNSYFNPATYGGGTLLPPVWQDTTTVSFLEVAQVISNVPGVLYIPSGDLTIATHGNSPGTVDLTLPGDAPMPNAGTFSVTVLASS